MRHRKGIKKLAKPTDQRIALLKSLVGSLIKYKKIKTTYDRAKEAGRMMAKMITLAKKGDLASRRKALKVIIDKGKVKELFNISKDRFGSRPGGYTRITKIGPRKGDAAEMAMLELL